MIRAALFSTIPSKLPVQDGIIEFSVEKAGNSGAGPSRIYLTVIPTCEHQEHPKLYLGQTSSLVPFFPISFLYRKKEYHLISTLDFNYDVPFEGNLRRRA